MKDKVKRALSLRSIAVFTLFFFFSFSLRSFLTFPFILPLLFYNEQGNEESERSVKRAKNEE